MVSLDKHTNHVSVGHPRHQLQHDARDGNLFVCHLAYESKPVCTENPTQFDDVMESPKLAE
jgi:hypothetical protein